MWNDIDDSINRFFEYCSKYTVLAIYGAGDVGQMVAEFMNEKGISFDFFCVTRKAERNTTENHEVREINEVICSDREMGIIVAVSRKNVSGILETLDERGCSYFYCKEFLFQLFKRKCQISASRVQIENGFIAKVKDVVLKRNTMYVCCPASIGDTLYVAAFVRAYKAEENNGQKVCLIIKKSHSELGTLFPGVDETLVSDEIVETLDRYSMQTQTWRLKNYIYGHFKKSLNFEYHSEYNREDCRKILPRYGKLILNLSEDTRPESIMLNSDTVHMQKQSSEIMIMPYARTAEMLPVSFWEKLVRLLSGKGYSIYTNVGSEKEKAIPGTKPVKDSLLNTTLFCERCAAVVSLRSGLCDLLGFTKTKLIVVNTSEELFLEWNLNDVFCRDGIYNVNCYEESNYGEKLEKIIEIVG